tara:strand:- start:372 stop:566 length:195 start_codon:yes stop_codon:yes gene_type:complete
MNNLKNPLTLGKVLKIYTLTSQNKQLLVLLPNGKTASWSAINKLARKREFMQTVVDQKKSQQWK